MGKFPKKYIFFAFTPNHTEACLVFATFCFQHIQVPKKDPDYEGRTVTWASLLLPQRSWRLLTFDTFEKAAFMVCSTIIRELKSHKLQML